MLSWYLELFFHYVESQGLYGYVPNVFVDFPYPDHSVSPQPSYPTPHSWRARSKAGENNGMIRPPAESVPGLNNRDCSNKLTTEVWVGTQTLLASPLGNELVGVIGLTPCSAYVSSYPEHRVSPQPSYPVGQHPTAGESTPMTPLGHVIAGCWQINSILTNIGRRNSIQMLNQYLFLKYIDMDAVYLF